MSWYAIVGLAFMVMIVVYIGLFPLVQKRQMKHQQEEAKAFMASLAPGDEVTLADGIIGTIDTVNDKEARIVIAPHTEIRVKKAGIVMKKPVATTAESATPTAENN